MGSPAQHWSRALVEQLRKNLVQKRQIQRENCARAFGTAQQQTAGLHFLQVMGQG